MKNQVTFYDKHHTEIKTGCVVRISNAYFKSDNGLWLVVHAAGDPCWTGNDLCLHKLRRDGKLSETKYRINFWPLTSVVSDRAKTAAANAWNRENAEIEIVEPKTYEHIGEYFLHEARSADQQAEFIERNWTETDASRSLRNKSDFLRTVADSLPA